MATYVEIASVTVGSGGALSVDFTSIPQTYTDLLLMASSRPEGGGGADLQISFNSDTTDANYPAKRLLGTGSAVPSDSLAHYQLRDENPSYTANTFTNGSLYIPNYTGSTYKSHLGDSVSENNDTQAIQLLTANIWNNTAAITAIKVTNYYNYIKIAQYSSFYLYGIKKD